MDDLHKRLLLIGYAAGEDLGLVLAGGYALVAHGIVDRPSRDIDFATNAALQLPLIAERLATAYQAAGYEATIAEGSLRMARLLVSSITEACEVDVMKEAIGPPARLRVGPVLAFDDAVV
jgi:hypothetical protein